MTDTNKSPSHRRIRLASRLGIAITVVGLLLVRGFYFQVHEGSSAVVTRFGQPIREVNEAGPHFKWPWPVEQARSIDTRTRMFNTPYTATLTRDRKNIILLTYVAWRVEKPLLFLQSVGDAAAAERKLDGMVTAAKNIRVGNHELTALLSLEEDQLRTSEIEAEILREVSGPARETFGVAVEQIGIKRIAYPEDNVQAVLAQMRAERKAEADKLRAEGEKAARQIRDDAQVKAEELLRTGREESGRIRGEAEKQAAGIYARVNQADPEFYRFWRSLQALKKTLGSQSTVILRTDQGFFDALSNPPDSAGVTPPALPSPAPATAPRPSAPVSVPNPSTRRTGP
jgi:membrane protease subunit HflC